MKAGNTFMKALINSPLQFLLGPNLTVITVTGCGGATWAAVRRELGNPWDVRLAIDGWVENRWVG